MTYIRTTEGTPSKALLDDTTFKVHPSRVYALAARNGAGKSSLLQHMHAKTLTGFPPHVSTFLVSQKEESDYRWEQTVEEYFNFVHQSFGKQSATAHQHAVEDLEAAMDALDLETEQGQKEMESLTEQLAAMDEDTPNTGTSNALDKEYNHALEFMGLSTEVAYNRFCDLSKSETIALTIISKVLVSHILLQAPDKDKKYDWQQYCCALVNCYCWMSRHSN